MKAVVLSLSLLGAAAGQIHPQISGPYTHENLVILLIHGQGTGKRYLTLKEAMEQKKVIVHETGNVNKLAVENVSGEDVFINSGDILKGGQQDRTLPNDFVLPTRSGRVPIAAFCVERGRWRPRGTETVAVFAGAAEMVATKELKKAVKSGNQAQVWSEVDTAMRRADRAVSASVRAKASPKSFTLQLESKALNEALEGYLGALGKLPEGKSDAIGFAYAVNGQVSGADVYVSPELFSSLWPKLLKSAAVEALSRRRSGETYPAPSAAAVEALLREAERGKESSREISSRVRLVSRESDNQMLFESRDGGAWVHRSYIVK